LFSLAKPANANLNMYYIAGFRPVCFKFSNFNNFFTWICY
jgi:hypothetical protein